jgi:hypothetical protein
MLTIFYFQSGFVQREFIEEYEKNRAKFMNKRRGKDFKDAVIEMDEFISDSVVNQ